MNYAIVFQPRSGSSNIAQRLNNEPAGLVNAFELLVYDTALQLSLIDAGDEFGAREKADVLERYYSRYSHCTHVGMKVAPYQMADDTPGIFLQIKRLCPKIIFLYRNNVVRVALSQIWSLERRRKGLSPSVIVGEEAIGKFHVDHELFNYYLVASLLEREAVLALSKLQEDKLLISYEDLYRHGDVSHELVFDYLGLAKDLPMFKSPHRKGVSNDMSKYISNYDDVVQWCANWGGEGALESDYAECNLRGDAISSYGASIGDNVITRTRELIDRQPETNDQAAAIRGALERAANAERYNEALRVEIANLQQMNANSLEIINSFKDRAERAEAYNAVLLNERANYVKG